MSDFIIISPESEPFWKAAQDGHLVVQRCADCGAVFLTPRTFCPDCSSERVDWMECSGAGTVYSYTIVWRGGAPDVPVPYVLALVDLEEGPRLMTHIIDCDHEQLRVGMKVRARFEPPIAGKPMPRFAPVRE